MIGIDIGRVIISGDTDIPNQFFSEDYLSVLPVNQAFDAIRQIVEKYGSTKVHLVSKCGELTQQRTLHWLDHHQFFETTGVFRSQVWFCRERHEKQGICEAQGIRTFIDDRFTVLQHLLELDRLLLFCPSEKELEAFEAAQKPEKIQIVDGWETALKVLIK
ncbi:MAG TPA: hypothetical protein DCS93_36980 [Microscillaceae bacterium]|nr:hypothetical protein [Microscillaceae bacterium]